MTLLLDINDMRLTHNIKVERYMCNKLEIQPTV